MIARAADGSLRTMRIRVTDAVALPCDDSDPRPLVDADGVELVGELDLLAGVDFGIARLPSDTTAVCGLTLTTEGAEVALEAPSGAVATASLLVSQVQLGSVGEGLSAEDRPVVELGYPGWIGLGAVGLGAGQDVTVDGETAATLADRIAAGSAVYVDEDGDGIVDDAEREAGIGLAGESHPAGLGVMQAVALVGLDGVLGKAGLDGEFGEIVRPTLDGQADLQAVAGGPLGAVAIGEKDGEPWAEYSAGLGGWSEVALEGVIPGDIAYGGGRYVIVGVSAQAFTSLDGKDWQAVTLEPADLELYALAYGDGVFVAAGQRGTDGVVVTSADGRTWGEPVTVDRKVIDLAYGDGRFVAVGQGGLIVTSDDAGATWTPRDSGTGEDLRHVRFLGDTFFSVQGSTVVESDLGDVWSTRTLSIELSDLAWTGETHLGVDGTGTVWRSDDRAEWTEVATDEEAVWTALSVSGR